jgi:hypothetical protein
VKRPTFTPVNRIGALCECCGREGVSRSVRGVRVDVKDGFTLYYCNPCVRALEKAHGATSNALGRDKAFRRGYTTGLEAAARICDSVSKLRTAITIPRGAAQSAACKCAWEIRQEVKRS